MYIYIYIYIYIFIYIYIHHHVYIICDVLKNITSIRIVPAARDDARQTYEYITKRFIFKIISLNKYSIILIILYYSILYI